ncbi:MAG: hypothetical protein AUH78_21135 [Gemmatimonadetes bacterium 13_1_40CM_4_69_8]|nr:MAG: hypothetical protein AUH46_05440 [Gemmatimonadetes bacterium 13_1_40CM_70_15]OLC70412.1 MAG: hypothetical protein AUH78_21135 [Gemmatimonadetes bacterium 13_1_40CM_4_69_8]PYP72489.1 MAG: hypothetical protein DMD41_08725 [Gemmatimonadota bacterium]
MVQHQLSPNQQRKVDEITELQKTVSHVRTLVTELESNRAAKTTIVTNLCGSIARELSQMRQRLLTAPIGTVADIAGALAIMASRTGGLNMKLRGLTDGVNSLDMQLDQALKAAMAPEAKDKAKK